VDEFHSFWDERGSEVPIRLKASPLRSYDQITALLKDRPTHKGMDFKTPTGTPVVSPRAGTVTRTEWRSNVNGHCVELQYSDGARARFLHLSSVKIRPGQRVGAGAVLGASGNTGVPRPRIYTTKSAEAALSSIPSTTTAQRGGNCPQRQCQR
jgi:murein DD-endopeptidase MepM/ murein hydrolase activator NlpD